MALLPTGVFLWFNYIVMVHFADNVSGVMYTHTAKKFTIPAKGGTVRIKSPFDLVDEPHVQSLFLEAEYAKRYGVNGTLYQQRQPPKARHVRSNSGGTTNADVTNRRKRDKELKVSHRNTSSENRHNLTNVPSPVTEVKESGTKTFNPSIEDGLTKTPSGNSVEESNLAIPDDLSGKEKSASVTTETDNLTEPQNDDSAAITAQREVTSVYIGTNYKFFAAIHYTESDKISFDDVKCSGGILSETAVVTSCSCLLEERQPKYNSHFLYVIVGHQKLGEIQDLPLYRVHGIIYHPSCSKKEGLWVGNIAMLTLKKPIQFTDNVQPMKVPELTMWDALDILSLMSSERRRCRIIGWSSVAPLVDTAIGELIPLDECANPQCSKKSLPCPRRTRSDGFMVEITPNEPSLLPGALLFCQEQVFAIVDTKRQCKTNNVFAMCSPEELLYAANFNFTMEGPAEKEMREYKKHFENLENWTTYTYSPTHRRNPPTSVYQSGDKTKLKSDNIEDIARSAALSPWHAYREASWIIIHILSVGYSILISIL